MSQKSVWHTDIVVDGQGFNVKIMPKGNGQDVTLTPDTPGESAESAMARFSEALRYRDTFDSAESAKAAVEIAVGKTAADWNGWHRESYSA